DRDRDDDDRPRRRDRDDEDDRPRRRDRDEDDERVQDRPRRRSRDDDDDRPRRRKSGGSPLLLVLLIGGPILLVGILGLGLVMTMGGGGLGNRVTQANADRIKMGMSENEVNAIIGAGIDYNVALDKRAGSLPPDTVKFVKGMMEMSKAFGVTVKIHEGFG